MPTRTRQTTGSRAMRPSRPCCQGGRHWRWVPGWHRRAQHKGRRRHPSRPCPRRRGGRGPTRSQRRRPLPRRFVRRIWGRWSAVHVAVPTGRGTLSRCRKSSRPLRRLLKRRRRRSPELRRGSRPASRSLRQAPLMPVTLLWSRRRASARCRRRRLRRYSLRRGRRGSGRRLISRQAWMLRGSRRQKLWARCRLRSRRQPTRRSCDPVCSSEPRSPSRVLTRRVHRNHLRQSQTALRRRLCSSYARRHGHLCQRWSLQPQKSLHCKPVSQPTTSAVQSGLACSQTSLRRHPRSERSQPSRRRRPCSLRACSSGKHRRLSPKCHCCGRHPGRHPRPRSQRNPRNLQRLQLQSQRQQTQRQQDLHSGRRRSRRRPHRARRRNRALQRRLPWQVHAA